ncbi:MAG: DnaD domain protein [Clostridia bacterium]|nr:DnaD domain protein [Clostridia bacterium]
MLAQAREEALSTWNEYFGKSPYPIVIEQIVQRGIQACGFEAGVVREAIRLASMRNAESPLDYIFTLFRDWALHGIRTTGDLERYAMLYDASRGKLLDCNILPREGFEGMKEMAKCKQA